jgi:hypothetical protein
MTKLTTGLKLKPTYEELMNKIIDDNIIQPKRTINLLDNQWFLDSFEFSELKKMALIDLERLDEGIRKQQLMEDEAKKIAKENGTATHAVMHEMRQPSVKTFYYEMSDGDKYEQAEEDAIDEAMNIEKEEEERKMNKVKKTIKDVKSNLLKSKPKTLANKIAMRKYKPSPDDDADTYEEIAPEQIPQKSVKQPKKKKTKKDSVKEAGTNIENKIVEKIENQILKKEGKQSKKEAKELKDELKLLKEERKYFNTGNPANDPKMQPKIIEKIAVRKKNKQDAKKEPKKEKKKQEREEVKTIIDNVPDKYDSKRRKVEKKKSDAEMKKTGDEIKVLYDKAAAKDEYRKISAEVAKQKQMEKITKGGSSSSSSVNVFGMRGSEAAPLPSQDLEAPSKMNMPRLMEILQHKANNNKLSKQGKSEYQDAKNNLLQNKADKDVKLKTLVVFRRIYKDEVYKK